MSHLLVQGIEEIKCSQTTTRNLAQSTEREKEGTEEVIRNGEIEKKLRDEYRLILENLLRLKNELITKCIRQAINEELKNLSSTTSDDWLHVLCKAFQLILNSINLKQIYLNETYLNANLTFLAKVIETGKLLQLVENKSVTQKCKKLFISNMAEVLTAISMEGVNKTAKNIFDNRQRNNYANVNICCCLY